MSQAGDALLNARQHSMTQAGDARSDARQHSMSQADAAQQTFMLASMTWLWAWMAHMRTMPSSPPLMIRLLSGVPLMAVTAPW